MAQPDWELGGLRSITEPRSSYLPKEIISNAVYILSCVNLERPSAREKSIRVIKRNQAGSNHGYYLRERGENSIPSVSEEMMGGRETGTITSAFLSGRKID